MRLYHFKRASRCHGMMGVFTFDGLGVWVSHGYFSCLSLRALVLVYTISLIVHQGDVRYAYHVYTCILSWLCSTHTITLIQSTKYT